MLEVSHYLTKLRTLPPGIAFKKICLKLFQVLQVKLEGIIARFFPKRISDEKLLQAFEGFSRLEEIVRTIRGERPHCFLLASREEIVGLIKRHFWLLEGEIVEEADRICSHIFDLLGSGLVNLDEFTEQHGGREKCGYLPWHFDFKTGHQWSLKKYFKEIRPAYGNADIKVPWELSRFQHVVALGQAYWLTGNEKYALEFVRQVEDWIERNPPKFGVNWACTMDVAIRAANWVLGFYFFKDSPTLTDEFLIKFLKSLLVHSRHIMSNLENKGITNNHYLANLVGLIYLGIAFPEFKEAQRWREFVLRELIKEMDKQVYNDGMDFEASTCYHRLALELFFYPTVLCQVNGIEMPQAFIDKLKKMFDFVLYVLKPNGRMPQIGDNDNGRLHVFGRREILDMTYLLTFGALFYRDPAYKITEFGFAPEALWVFGPDAYERWNSLPGRSVEELESRAFPEGGIYVMRHKKDYMIISCGPNGQGGLGGHAHNDKLSFELCIGGEDVIVDPGTYVYTPCSKWRNMFRSTSYHNTVMVNGQEQNPVEEDKIFYLPDFARCRCLVWETGPEGDVFVGEHYGYLYLDSPMVHRRKMGFYKSKRTWTIVDLFYLFSESNEETTGMNSLLIQHKCLLNFNLHLAPEKQAISCSRLTLDSAPFGSFLAFPRRSGSKYWANGSAALSAVPVNRIDKEIILVFYVSRANRLIAEVQSWGWLNLDIETAWASSGYGHKEESMMVSLQAQFSSSAAKILSIRALL